MPPKSSQIPSQDRKFRAGRQDYWFRYNTAMQLHLVGESLVGWMANDLSRCLDVLLARPAVGVMRWAQKSSRMISPSG